MRAPATVLFDLARTLGAGFPPALRVEPAS
jgi:hypothetical protein